MELLTLDEFAARMKISRTTAYSIALEELLPAGYVIRRRRILRILWSEALLGHLSAISSCETEVAPHPKIMRNGTGGRNRISLNPEYLENIP